MVVLACWLCIKETAADQALIAVDVAVAVEVVSSCRLVEEPISRYRRLVAHLDSIPP